jgi:hypothetical protein
MNRAQWVSNVRAKNLAREDEDAELKEAVYMAIGQAGSVHWRASGEVFDTTEFCRISEELITNIKRIR